MSRNDSYTIRNLLGYLHDQNYYKIIGIDLPRQTNGTISQVNNFTKTLEENKGATMFFNNIEKQPKTKLNFSLYSLIVTA